MSIPFDELSFLNQQLAAMLRDGLPLEGALREICQQMGRGELREELRKLEADLATGTPLAQALPARRLPPLYVQTVLAGVKGNDLPGVLTLLADYYGQAQSIWVRLKGLMVYPALVLAVSLLLSGWMAFLQRPVVFRSGLGFHSLGSGVEFAPASTIAARGEVGARTVYFWMPPVFLLGVVATATGLLAFSRTRRALRWRLPAFKEASLAQFASAMHMLLRNGVTLPEAIDLLSPVEEGTAAGVELERWARRIKEGTGKFSLLARDSSLFPPLFVWLASSGGDDLAAGFERAAEVYRQRALYRIELLLNGFLPASMLLLGIMVVLQVYPLTTQAYEGMQSLWGIAR